MGAVIVDLDFSDDSHGSLVNLIFSDDSKMYTYSRSMPIQFSIVHILI